MILPAASQLDAIASLAEKAQRSIWLSSFTISPPLLGKHQSYNKLWCQLLDKAKAGLNCRIVGPSSSTAQIAGDRNSQALRMLVGAGWQSRTIKTAYPLHAKIFLFDDVACIVGSGNLTSNGMTSPLEIFFELQDPVNIRQVRERYLGYWTMPHG